MCVTIMTKQLTCPNDGAVLSRNNKNGIEIDYCTTCGGVWLDHGELEKLINLSQENQSKFGPPNISSFSHQQYYTDDNHQNHHKKKEKGGWLGDIFDF
jgi:uncharacterized protein